MRKDIRNPMRDALVKAIQELYTDPKGKLPMTQFRINSLVPFLNELLHSIEKVIMANRNKADLVARKKH